MRIVQSIRKMSLLLALAGLLLGIVSLDGEGLSSVQAAPATDRVNDENLADKVEDLVLQELKAAGQTDFFVWMVEKANLNQAARLMARTQKAQFVFETLRNTAARTQMSLRADLNRQGVSYQTFYIANKILVRGGDAALVNALAARSDVARITANHTYQLDAFAVSPNPQIGILAVASNLTFINADDVWADGYTGAGIVLAGSDTGLDWDHPAIKPHYRGWDGTTVDHNYNWWDATGAYPNAPADGHGHGTHTTGTMIGDDGVDNKIGVAPGAQTMHCKSLDDSGTGTDATITECFEWYLSPWDLTGSNPDPAQAPDAINNSWGAAGGNALQFENEITALQAAGILVEASAGNEGPTCGSLRSPGDYRGVLTTGSVNSSGAFPGTLSTTSSRGPSQPYPGAYFPDVMAPGENIRSAQPGGTYTSMSGTSMAGPHVTGLVALMWEANPDLRGLVDQTAQLIADTAVPLAGQTGLCGGDYTNGPNNDWGHGTIDADAAVQAALAYGSAGDIIRVTPTGATSDICGGDWGTPCNLLYALNSVANVGDELWVAEGVYKPTTDPADQEAYIPLKTEVDVYGGFAMTETLRSQRDPAANVTIFSGDIDSNDNQSPIVTDAYAVTGTTTNSYHVVAGTPTGATLDGVTITGGYGYYGCTYGWNSQFGGGLYTQGAMMLNNVTFSGNQNWNGGGLYTTAPLTVTNSTFTGNYASGAGGGIHNGADDTSPILMINVTFTNNRATYDGGGAYGGGTLILNNVTFTDNWAGSKAGGLYAAGAALLTNVTFERNRGDEMGGGMHVAGTWPVTLDRVIFEENYGPNSGGGLSSWSGNVTLNNVVFFGNSAHQGDAMKLGNLGGGWTLNNVLITGNGIGYAIATSGPMTLTNVTIANQGGAIQSWHPGVVIRNSIIWDDHVCPEGHNGCAAPTISHSIVWGGWAGTGNLNADPLLAPLGDYGGAVLSRALLPGSPAIDMGDPATCLATDMRGLPRSSPCDVGAFESQGFTFSDLTGAPQSATLNGAFIDPLGLTVTANDLNEPVAGGQVSFSAPGSGASATFTGNPATIGASGAASLTVTANDILGSYVVTATVGTSSTPVQFTLSNVEGDDTFTTLTSAPNPSEYNAPVTFTATVTSTVGTPIGTVQFYADGASLGAPVALVDGVASTSTSSLNTGVHPITANYRGDPTHNVSTSNQVDQTVSCTDVFTVTNANNDGVGALRYAFDALCAGGIITFDADYTVTLSSALVINKAMTISGAGHHVTLDANHASRVFEIAATGVTLDHLTLTGGQAPPANCGPWNDRCGGAIWMGISSNAVLQNSTLSGNSANRGGGIFNYSGTLTVLNSVISGNSGSSQGGGIFNSHGTVNVTNSTFSGNASAQGGAIAYNNGTVSIANGIQWGNSGGGLGENNLGADPRFVAPIAASAAPTTTGNYRLGPGSPAIDRGSNAAAEQADLTTDRDGNPRIVNGVVDMGAYEAPPQSILVFLDKTVAPTLDVPEDGIVTYTLVARNVGTEGDMPAVLTDTLPRGVVFKQWVERPAGAVANTQAITWTGTLTGNAAITLTFQATRTVAAAGEWVINTAYYSGTIHTTQASAEFAPTCADAITVQNAQTDGPGSLNDAIIGLCPGGTITFADAAAIYLNGPLDIRKDMTIDGDGHRVILSGDSGNDGSRNTRVVNIAPGNAVTLSHLSIVSGTASAGGGIFNEGDLTVLHSTIADNTASAYGGGIRNVAETLVVRNSTLSGNHADLNGGGINSTAMVTLANSTLTGNTSTLEQGGGGIWQAGGQLAYYNTVIANSSNGDCLGGDILANVNNLVEDGGCSAAFSGDPLLGPLADNGGSTPTHAPLPGSPAIDAGDPTTCLATDQRGEPRADLRCDIGAFELQHADSDTVIKTFDDSIQHSFGPTWLSMTLATTGSGTLTVTKHLDCAGGTCDAGEVPVTWHITSTLSEGLPLSLSFCYTDAEIAELNESALRAFRWDGVQWTTPISTGLTVDEAANCVTLTGIGQFSMWTLKDVSNGDETPTAVILPSFTARSGLWRIGLLLAVGAGVVVLQRSTRRNER